MLAVIRATALAVIVSLALAPLSSLASSDEDVARLNAAWQAYVDSLESGDKGLILDASAAAVDAGRKVFDENTEELPVLLYNHGRALLDNGQNGAAALVLKESLELSEKQHGKDAVELIGILTALGDSVAEPLSSSAQFRYYKRSLKITEQHFGRESKQFADASVRVATRGYELSQTTEGIRNLRDAREAYAALNGEDSAEVGLTDYLLAKFEFSRGKHKSAVKHGLTALPNLEGDTEDLRRLQMFTRALLVKAYEERNMSEEATPHCIAIGRISKTDSSKDYLPLFRLAPRYPEEQLRRGKEGHVEFEFTIDEHGFVRDPQVIASTGKGFESAARDAVERFRYAPRFVDGVATPVDGVKTRISFEIED